MLVGVTKIKHLEDNVKASEITITEDIKKEIDSILIDSEMFT